MPGQNGAPVPTIRFGRVHPSRMSVAECERFFVEASFLSELTPAGRYSGGNGWCSSGQIAGERPGIPCLAIPMIQMSARRYEFAPALKMGVTPQACPPPRTSARSWDTAIRLASTARYRPRAADGKATTDSWGAAAYIWRASPAAHLRIHG